MNEPMNPMNIAGKSKKQQQQMQRPFRVRAPVNRDSNWELPFEGLNISIMAKKQKKTLQFIN